MSIGFSNMEATGDLHKSYFIRYLGRKVEKHCTQERMGIRELEIESIGRKSGVLLSKRKRKMWPKLEGKWN